MAALLYFGGAILMTIIVTVPLCRYQLAHKKLIAWDTVFVGSLIANMVVFTSFAFYEEGFHLFTREAWSGGKGGLTGVLIIFGFITVLCLLPALGVANYFQRRGKREENHAPQKSCQ